MTLVSIILFCVETLPMFSKTHCVGNEAPNFLDPFFIIETVCTAVVHHRGPRAIRLVSVEAALLARLQEHRRRHRRRAVLRDVHQRRVDDELRLGKVERVARPFCASSVSCEYSS
jgi:hypothetical protein